MMNLKIKHVASHRNGVAGEGFHVVLFTWRDGRKTRNMVATLFEGDGQSAVLDVDETAKGNVAFAQGNSWRGDDFEPELRKAIDAVYSCRIETLCPDDSIRPCVLPLNHVSYCSGGVK